MAKVSRVLCVLAAFSLIGAWCWISWGLSDVALDYPVRRAGESDIYPALDTFAFYANCAYQLLEVHAIASVVWGIPLILALCCLFAGFKVKSWMLRTLVALVILITPATVFSFLKMRRAMIWAKSENSRSSI